MNKIPGVERIGPGAKKKAPAAKIPEKFFRAAGEVWIEVFGEVMPKQDDGEKADPGFWDDGTEKRHLKLLLRSLRERAEKKQVVWTEDEMRKRLRAYFLMAWSDDYLHKNFMLRILNINKTKIFNNQITPKRNAGNINSGGAKKSPTVTTKPKGGFGEL